MRVNINAGQIARSAILTALYVVMTVVLPFPAYGGVQFRFSEILVLLCFYNPVYCVSMTLGCAIANLFSPFAYIDVVFGTLATVIAVIPMYRLKKLWVAALLPVLTNGVIVGLEVAFIYKLPLLFTCLSVAAGEFAVVVVVGVPLFKLLLEKNKPFMRIICKADTPPFS